MMDNSRYEKIPFAIVIPEDEFVGMDEEEKYNLTRQHKVDYLVIKRRETKLFYRYFEPEYLPSIGDLVTREGNHFTTLGEGVYCYPLESLADDVEYMEGRVIGILEGKDVEYYQIVYDSDGEGKDLNREIVVKPNQNLYLIGIVDK